jgi:FKBP-type peptidyl-prolyl cis-trans isomerase
MMVMRRLRWLVIFAFPFVLSACIDREPVVDSVKQMEDDLAQIDNYLATNNIDAIKDKSGVRYHIEKIGTGGFPPRTDQQIKVKYVGKFLSGNVFDAGGIATEFVNRFITGWQFGVTVWPAGTKGTIYVPSPLGYGPQQVSSIPPNSILVFDVELQEVILSNAEKARLTSDIAAIDQHLADRSIDAVKDTTGVRYVITNAGTGAHPDWFTKVRFSYTGKLLTSGTQFFSGTSQPTDTFDSRVIDFVHGIKLGLTKIGSGGKITVYVPSGLAFGPYDNTTSAVPANSIVVYDIEIQEIY